jgi:hypothetical protein
MPQIDTFGMAVRAMMDQWGRTFAMHRDGENLGFATKNILYELMRHEGAPPRTTGNKPLEINLQALAVEYAVLDIARDDAATAWVLRAYHCGQGRRRFERFWFANHLLARAGLAQVRMSGYLDLAERGEQRVARILAEEAKPDER